MTADPRSFAVRGVEAAVLRRPLGLIDVAFREQPEMSWHELLARMLLPSSATSPAPPEEPRLFEL